MEDVKGRKKEEEDKDPLRLGLVKHTRLSGGANGNIYLASIGRRYYTLKTYDTSFTAEGKWQRSAKALARLPIHHGWPTVWVAWKDHVLMDFVPGKDLFETRGLRGNSGAVFSIGVQVLEILGFLHSKGLAHKDVKPENIMVHDGVATLVDMEETSPFTPTLQEANESVGTPLFMSKSRFDTKMYYSPWEDFYALGLTLVDVFTAGVCQKDAMYRTEIGQLEAPCHALLEQWRVQKARASEELGYLVEVLLRDHAPKRMEALDLVAPETD